ncbi:hypothetical protein NFI96_030539, partial [Prochilodus magdalenae]
MVTLNDDTDLFNWSNVELHQVIVPVQGDVIKNRNVPLTWTNQITTQTFASKTLTIVPHPAPVSEMERCRAVLLTLVCVLFSGISGAEVEMRVRPGDNVTLYSDCVRESGTSVVWFRKSLNEDQTPLIISGDLGLYYCAVREKKYVKGILRDVYHNGTRTTRLSLLDPPVPCADLPFTPSTPSTLEEHSTLQTTSTPPVSDCSVCWKLLVSVCPVCVLLSTVVPSGGGGGGGYIMCTTSAKRGLKVLEREDDHSLTVCY